MVKTERKTQRQSRRIARINASIGIAQFSNPIYSFNINIDQLMRIDTSRDADVQQYC
jgi:hypothetical protein